MIEITYRKTGGVTSLTAKGHAGYDDTGRDIVCAAVSALTQSIAAALAQTGAESWCLRKGDELRVIADVTTPSAGGTTQERVAQQVRGAFAVARCGLRMIADKYPENVRYTEL